MAWESQSIRIEALNTAYERTKWLPDCDWRDMSIVGYANADVFRSNIAEPEPKKPGYFLWRGKWRRK